MIENGPARRGIVRTPHVYDYASDFVIPIARFLDLDAAPDLHARLHILAEMFRLRVPGGELTLRDPSQMSAPLVPRANIPKRVGLSPEALYKTIWDSLPPTRGKAVCATVERAHKRVPAGKAIWVRLGYEGLKEEIGAVRAIERQFQPPLNWHSGREGSLVMNITTLDFSTPAPAPEVWDELLECSRQVFPEGLEIPLTPARRA